MDGVYRVLRDGEITAANPAACEIFGYTKEEMIGKDIRELYFDPADHPRFQKQIEEKGFVKDYEVKDYEVKFRKRDGTEVECLLTSSVHYAKDGSITGYRGIMRDLTARKALQRQLLQAQKMEALGTMAGGIAHDFNNLLQVIVGNVDMGLLRCKQGQPGFLELQQIKQAATCAAELTKGLLTLSSRVPSSPGPST